MTNINRASDDQYADIEGSMIDFEEENVDVNRMLDEEGRLKAKYYNKFDGGFDFMNIPNLTANVDFYVGNATTELIMYYVLMEPWRINLEDERLIGIRKMINFVNMNIVFLPNIKKAFIDNVKYLRAERVGRGEIENPNTGRAIKVRGATYKRMYGDIILRRFEEMGLSSDVDIKYKIETNCAVDLLTDYEGMDIKDIEDILERDVNNDITVSEIIKVYEDYDIPIKILNFIGDVYYEEKGVEAQRVFKIYGDHIYLLNNGIKKRGRRTILLSDEKKIKKMDKEKFVRYVVTDSETFEKVKEKIRETDILCGYDNRGLKYGNTKIEYNPYYEEDKKILNSNKSKCRTVYNMIDRRLELTGYMNDECFDYFYKSQKIRYMNSERKNDIVLDMNKAYPSQLVKEGIKFGVPTINDRWEVFKKEGYREGGFYYCMLNSYDEILAPNDDIYTWYEVEILKNEGRIKKIKYMFNPSIIIKLRDEDREWLKNINMDRVRSYIGWLMMHNRCVFNKYDKVEGMKNDDYEAMQYKYGEQLKERKDHIMLTRIYKKRKNGILVNLMIKAQSNIELYKMNKDMERLNNGMVKLNTIRTDSLGYAAKPGYKIILPDDRIKQGLGYWKIENKEQKYFNNNKTVYKIDEPVVRKIKVKEHNENDIEKLLDDRESFIIHGDFGTGKTFSVNNNVEKKMKEKGIRYIKMTLDKNEKDKKKIAKICSMTEYDLKNKLKNVEYVIVDEAQTMNEELINVMEFASEKLGKKIILVGDENQINGNIMGFGKKWVNSYMAMRLTNGNMIKLTEQKRCDDKIVENIKMFEKKPMDSYMRIACELFKTTDNLDECELHIYKYKTTKEKILKNRRTIQISAAIGSTIEEKYMIHNLKNMTKEELITALTRAREYENIWIYTGK